MEYYSATKNNVLMVHLVIRVTLESMLRNSISITFGNRENLLIITGSTGLPGTGGGKDWV